MNFDKDITGWPLVVLLDKFQQYVAVYTGIKRLAIMSDSSLLKWRLNLFQLNPQSIVERFSNKDMEKAKAWLAIG